MRIVVIINYAYHIQCDCHYDYHYESRKGNENVWFGFSPTTHEVIYIKTVQLKLQLLLWLSLGMAFGRCWQLLVFCY
ncbi:hypothetical protein EB796_009709 [Bugula neritina]|uniref:Uncharacterized protein n=1 Tax=Bugula neritina TaxID=10212 RepID=A0A7J7K1A3_BUGNE|nr:hypothetical protein EB796_009709 [Bugula neritina]